MDLRYLRSITDPDMIGLKDQMILLYQNNLSYKAGLDNMLNAYNAKSFEYLESCEKASKRINDLEQKIIDESNSRRFKYKFKKHHKIRKDKV